MNPLKGSPGCIGTLGVHFENCCLIVPNLKNTAVYYIEGIDTLSTHFGSQRVGF